MQGGIDHLQVGISNSAMQGGIDHYKQEFHSLYSIMCNARWDRLFIRWDKSA